MRLLISILLLPTILHIGRVEWSVSVIFNLAGGAAIVALCVLIGVLYLWRKAQQGKVDQNPAVV